MEFLFKFFTTGNSSLYLILRNIGKFDMQLLLICNSGNFGNVALELNW
mgnify:CR=1 FL=1